MKFTYKILLVFVCFIPYAISLFQIAYVKDYMENANTEYGLGVALIGWVNLNGAGISWLANPLLFASWIFILYDKFKTSTLLSLLAVFFSLSFLLFDEILANEGGGLCKILERGLGYWLWLTSCCVTLLINTTIYLIKNYR